MGEQTLTNEKKNKMKIWILFVAYRRPLLSFSSQLTHTKKKREKKTNTVIH